MADKEELQRLTELPCTDFAAALANKQSVPGGGGAAALVGAFGAALCSMVGNFTVGKKTYAAVEDDVKELIEEADDVRQKLIGLVNDDAVAFEPLSRAYGIPKDDPNRAATLEEATKAACVAPMEMMRQIVRAVELLEEMGDKGSRMLRSDVLCGAAFCAAALQSASVNVFTNTKTLADRDFAERLEREVDGLLDEYVPRAQKVVARMGELIRGRR